MIFEDGLCSMMPEIRVCDPAGQREIGLIGQSPPFYDHSGDTSGKCFDLLFIFVKQLVRTVKSWGCLEIVIIMSNLISSLTIFKIFVILRCHIVVVIVC